MYVHLPCLTLILVFSSTCSCFNPFHSNSGEMYVFTSYTCLKNKGPTWLFVKLWSEDGQDGSWFWSTYLKLSLHQKTEPEISPAALQRIISRALLFEPIQLLYCKFLDEGRLKVKANPFVPLWSCYAYFPLIVIDWGKKLKGNLRNPSFLQIGLKLGKKNQVY